MNGEGNDRDPRERVLKIPGGAEIAVLPDDQGGLLCGGNYWWCRLSLYEAKRWHRNLGAVIAEVEKDSRSQTEACDEKPSHESTSV